MLYLTNSGDSAARIPAAAIIRLAKKNVGFLPNLSVNVPNKSPPIQKYHVIYTIKNCDNDSLYLHICSSFLNV